MEGRNLVSRHLGTWRHRQCGIGTRGQHQRRAALERERARTLRCLCRAGDARLRDRRVDVLNMRASINCTLAGACGAVGAPVFDFARRRCQASSLGQVSNMRSTGAGACGPNFSIRNSETGGQLSKRGPVCDRSQYQGCHGRRFDRLGSYPRRNRAGTVALSARMMAQALGCMGNATLPDPRGRSHDHALRQPRHQPMPLGDRHEHFRRYPFAPAASSAPETSTPTQLPVRMSTIG